MPSYTYRARNKIGALVTGALDAPDMRGLEDALDRMGLIPVSAVPRGKALARSYLKRIFTTIPEHEVILFSRQLSTLFGAGVPLTRALMTLERQAVSPRFGELVKKVREEVEAGGTLSSAISKHPRVFPEHYSHMIESGEAGGILEGVLDRLALLLEKNSENRAKVKSATLYPKIVVLFIVMAIVILMNFVVPQFAKLYSTFKIELPLPTRALIIFSNWFTSYWYLALAGAAGVYLMMKVWFSTAAGKKMLDGASLMTPVFGPIILKSLLSRFSRVLGSLYKSGVPILHALDIASRAVENTVISGEIKAMEADVRAGKGLSGPMSASAHFPPLVVQMVTVGEETGRLDLMLEKAAQYYDQEVDSAIRNLTTTLEPLLLVVVFGVVLFLALAIFLPMWDIIKVVKR
ncbi:MAG: type II secretion system F family protein [Deltaproteobacteria bacterium]|nr:type II secretion system F family protein [Deltaproteobacteria bacterium]